MELRRPLEMCQLKTRELNLLLLRHEASGKELAPGLCQLSRARRHSQRWAKLWVGCTGRIIQQDEDACAPMLATYAQQTDRLRVFG